MSPGRATMSVVPATLWRSTLSATRKASSAVVPSGTRRSSRSLLTLGFGVRGAGCGLGFGVWLGVWLRVTVTTESAASTSRRCAISACTPRWPPSKRNGMVTTAMVSAPARRASRAMTGEAPEPVPPPMPAVTKTMSAPLTISRTAWRLSSAASRPVSGLPPAPRPRVSSSPIWSFLSALAPASDCASVLTAQYSTTSFSSPRWSRTMRSTALQPAPPTPMTRMLHGVGSTPLLLGAGPERRPGRVKRRAARPAAPAMTPASCSSAMARMVLAVGVGWQQQCVAFGRCFPLGLRSGFGGEGLG
mmetsp:Transcript_7145/g.20940  ORF Transcript_7145/g.20940 Transcript_7145/m.20940 type:complete len:303 (+) Transcript_7145:1448-2356(+)